MNQFEPSFKNIIEALNTSGEGLKLTAVALKEIWTEIDKINDRLDKIEKKGKYREYRDSLYKPRKITYR